MFFFLLRHRPPPNSTLFPYTTLFRSRLPGGRETRNVKSFSFEYSMKPDTAPFKLARVTSIERAGETETFDLQVDEHQDRKSTRLNSSHTVISYAVFCLKKKKRRRRPY